MRLIQKDLTAVYTVLGSMVAWLPSVTQNQAPVDLKAEKSLKRDSLMNPAVECG